MAQREDFTEGRVARLKTGGPLMVVEDTRTDTVPCVWFSGDAVCRDAFHHLALDLLPDSMLKPPKMANEKWNLTLGEVDQLLAGHVVWCDKKDVA